jgi:hypothetical protein
VEEGVGGGRRDDREVVVRQGLVLQLVSHILTLLRCQGSESLFRNISAPFVNYFPLSSDV